MCCVASIQIIEATVFIDSVFVPLVSHPSVFTVCGGSGAELGYYMPRKVEDSYGNTGS